MAPALSGEALCPEDEPTVGPDLADDADGVEEIDEAAGLFGTMSFQQRTALTALGLELLDAAEAEGLSWSGVSHNGFRPMRALGYARAAAAWRDYMTKSPATWRG